MARLYVQAVADNVTPWPSSTVVAWNKVQVTSNPLVLGALKAGSAANLTGTKTVTSPSTYSVLHRRFVSETVATRAGTLSGTCTGVMMCLENTTSSNGYLTLGALVITETGTVRGTLFNNYAETATAREFPTSSYGARDFSVAMSSVAVQPGDRILVEPGSTFRTNSITTSTTGFYAGGTGPDAASGNTYNASQGGTQWAPWFDFGSAWDTLTEPVPTGQLLNFF